MHYSNRFVPSNYCCARCKAHGVKIWREYQCFNPSLLCADCAMKNQGKSGVVDDEGKRESDCGRTDQIGLFVPAVPLEDGRGYWGYSSVPTEGCQWWKNLPTRK